MALLQNLKQDKLSLCCLIFLILLILCGIFAPLIAPHDPTALNAKLKFAFPSLTYPLGTDYLGRCILSRLLYGIRTTFFLSLFAMVCIVFIGTVVGVLSGYFGGIVDEILMRMCDMMLSFPSDVLVLAIVGILGAGMEHVILANIITKWAWYARMVRGTVLQYADRNYVRFAKVSGMTTLSILRHHLLPSIAGESLVLATLDMGGIILNISALSFLGLGTQAPAAEWGMMLSEAKNVLLAHPAQMVPAGMTIVLVVAACNFLGDGMQKALHPKHRKGES